LAASPDTSYYLPLMITQSAFNRMPWLLKLVWTSAICLSFALCAEAQTGETPDVLINKGRAFITQHLQNRDSANALEAVMYLASKYKSQQIIPFSEDEFIFFQFLMGDFNPILGFISALFPTVNGGIEPDYFYKPPHDELSKNISRFYTLYRNGILARINAADLRDDAKKALLAYFWVKATNHNRLSSFYPTLEYDKLLITYPNSQYVEALARFFKHRRYVIVVRDEFSASVLTAAGALGYPMESNLSPGLGIALLYRQHRKRFFWEFATSTHSALVEREFQNDKRIYPKNAALGYNLFQLSGGKRFFWSDHFRVLISGGFAFVNIRAGTVPARDSLDAYYEADKIPIHNQLHLNFGISLGHRFTRKIWRQPFNQRQHQYQACAPELVDNSSAICFKINWLPEIPVGGKSLRDCILNFGIWYEFGKNRTQKTMPEKTKQCILNR